MNGLNAVRLFARIVWKLSYLLSDADNGCDADSL